MAQNQKNHIPAIKLIIAGLFLFLLIITGDRLLALDYKKDSLADSKENNQKILDIGTNSNTLESTNSSTTSPLESQAATPADQPSLPIVPPTPTKAQPFIIRRSGEDDDD